MVPSTAKDGMIDVSVISGLLGLRRLRPKAAWPLVQTRSHVDGTPLEDEIPLEPSEANGPPFLRDFCSSPLPPFAGTTRRKTRRP